MDQFAALGSVAYKVHLEMRNLYYLLLPVFFMASVALVWIQNPVGGPEFLDKIKRAFVATLLLAGFAEITDAILFLTNGVADKIDTMSGLDAILQMASQKADSYTMSPMTPILAFDDFIVALLSYLSYAVLYFARFIMVAIYHFSWTLLTILAPMLLLFHVFTSQITVNLFKSMFEIASWKVVWAVLSVMLKALPFGTWYAMEGNYLTIAVLNFVIAICMFGTPLVVRSIVGSGLSAMTSGLAGVTGAVMLAAPAKALAFKAAAGAVAGNTKGFAQTMAAKVSRPISAMTSGRGQNSQDRTPPPPRRPPQK